jgi:hypothetical protein
MAETRWGTNQKGEKEEMNLEQKLMIVVEGFDNTGKSTLMEQIRSYTGVSGHASNGRPHSTQEMFNRMHHYLDYPHVSLHDRIHCISETVYGPIIRDQYTFTTPDGREIEKIFKATPHLIIYCRPPREYIFNYGDRGQMEGVIENDVKLLHAYDQKIRYMINEGGWRIMLHDYTDSNSLKQILFTIGGILNGQTNTGIQSPISADGQIQKD